MRTCREFAEVEALDCSESYLVYLQCVPTLQDDRLGFSALFLSRRHDAVPQEQRKSCTANELLVLQAS